MAQQIAANNQDDQFTIKNPASYTSVRAPAFTGGSIDPESRNFVPGSRQAAIQGTRPTGAVGLEPEKPTLLDEPPPPAKPVTRLAQITAPPPPAPPAPASFGPNPGEMREQAIGGAVGGVLGNVLLPGLGGPLGASVGSAIATPVTEAFEDVGKFFGGLFCHQTGTLIRMADGSARGVETLRIGDRVLGGGAVLGVGQVLCDRDLFEYMGVRVTGAHAVFEGEVFIRVRDSELARPVALETPVVVHPVVTARHLLVTMSHVAADFAEVDDGENMTPDERLSALNDAIGPVARAT